MGSTILFAVLGICLVANLPKADSKVVDKKAQIKTAHPEIEISDPQDLIIKKPPITSDIGVAGMARSATTLYVLRADRIDMYSMDQTTLTPTYTNSVVLDDKFGTPFDIKVFFNNKGETTIYIVAKRSDEAACIYAISPASLTNQKCIEISIKTKAGLKLHMTSKDNKVLILVSSRSGSNVAFYTEDGKLVQNVDCSGIVKYKENTPLDKQIYTVLDAVVLPDGDLMVSYGRNSGAGKNDYPEAGLCVIKAIQQKDSTGKPGKEWTGSCFKKAPSNPSINYPVSMEFDPYHQEIVIGDRGIDTKRGEDTKKIRDDGPTILNIKEDLEKFHVLAKVPGFFINYLSFAQSRKDNYIQMYAGGFDNAKTAVRYWHVTDPRELE